MLPEKQQARRQWESNPCGLETVAREMRPKSPEFYQAARTYRYGTYAPWFEEMVDLGRWHDKRVLEIGVGLGSDHYRLAANSNQTVGLDLSMEHLRHTSNHLTMEGFRTRLALGDAEYMPFRGSCFDLVYAFGVLHHTPGIAAAVAEIRRVLRPGGTLLISLYHRNSWFYWIDTILIRGIRCGRLFTRGYRKLLSEIEYRTDSSDAQPLVRVYSRRQVRRLLRDFAEIRIRTCHVEPGHFGPFHRLLPAWSRERLEKSLGFGGWYIIAEARRTDCSIASETD